MKGFEQALAADEAVRHDLDFSQAEETNGTNTQFPIFKSLDQQDLIELYDHLSFAYFHSGNLIGVITCTEQ